ncbi:uncharacterized protein TNCV_3019061 [Trichonephila clavipes]|nr:uncharacterized protein TNCV_3019061 [Trichonephila clavipes]
MNVLNGMNEWDYMNERAFFEIVPATPKGEIIKIWDHKYVKDRLDGVTAEIRERFQQFLNLAQKYAFLRTEVILNMDELNLDQAPQDIKKEFQLERVRLQAILATTDPGY